MTNAFFLDTRQATEAFNAFVAPGVRSGMDDEHFKRAHLHVVALRPGVPYVEDAPLPILFERSFGNMADWEDPFDKYARGKAHLSWRTGLSTREVILTKPQLIRPGDIVYYGSAVIDGVIAAASGAQPFFDEMVARMTCAAMIAEASYYAEEFSELGMGAWHKHQHAQA